jgi:hypothetical protein
MSKKKRKSLLFGFFQKDFGIFANVWKKCIAKISKAQNTQIHLQQFPNVRLVRPFSRHPQFFFHPPLQVNADAFITCVHHVCSVFIHIMCVTNCINQFLLGLFICFFYLFDDFDGSLRFCNEFEAFAAPPSCCNTCQECELEVLRTQRLQLCMFSMSCSICVQNTFSICVQSISIHDACNLRIRSSCGGCSPRL